MRQWPVLVRLWDLCCLMRGLQKQKAVLRLWWEFGWEEGLNQRWVLPQRAQATSLEQAQSLMR